MREGRKAKHPGLRTKCRAPRTSGIGPLVLAARDPHSQGGQLYALDPLCSPMGLVILRSSSLWFNIQKLFSCISNIIYISNYKYK